MRDILENEAGVATGDTPGEEPATITQFGGQTAINLAGPLSRVGLPLLGSSAETIDLAEDRRRFEELMNHPWCSAAAGSGHQLVGSGAPGGGNRGLSCAGAS